MVETEQQGGVLTVALNRPEVGNALNNEIGPSNNANFGKASGRTAIDDIQREYNLEYSASAQHQLLNNLSVTAGWYRRQYYSLIAEDNVALSPSDYRSFQVVNHQTQEGCGGCQAWCDFYAIGA